MPSPICQGDSTTGGGEVIRCQVAATHRINGHPLAVRGDYATCSLHPGEHSFVEGSSNHLAMGLPIVLEGHLLSCGCHAIAGKAAHIRVR